MRYLLLIFCLVLCFCYCDGGVSPVNKSEDSSLKLDAELRNRIIQDYFNQYYFNQVIEPNDAVVQLKDVQICKYYGTFGGYVVIMFNSAVRQAIGEETVAGVTINYVDSRRILVWTDGSFYRLQESYEKKILTEQNIRLIANAQNNR
ncbi:MAG: hypothetical protein LBC70_04260 [Chitinispirillales bacterium]|jgi:hypothetical protein|nr:hypothetical protein [Chitinispirillales bacterium]